MNKRLTLAIDKLGRDWANLNWEFRDFELNGAKDKMSQWQGDPEEDIMVVVFKGKHIEEPFHRQDFFFIDYAYQMDYNALSAKFDNLITVREGDCYIGQPFSGYAPQRRQRDRRHHHDWSPHQERHLLPRISVGTIYGCEYVSFFSRSAHG